MTLIEKFFKWYPKQDAEFIAEQCVKIADDFAIKFLDWCSSKEALDILVKLIDSKELDRNPTGKDLLKIFKKEKGL